LLDQYVIEIFEPLEHVAQNDTTAKRDAEIDVLRQVSDNRATLLEVKK